MKKLLLKPTGIFVVLMVALLHNVFAAAVPQKHYTGSEQVRFLPDEGNIKPAVKRPSFLEKKILRLTSKAQKRGKGSITLVVVVAVLLSLLLAFGIYLGAWGGAASAALVVIGILGLALIIFAAGKIIRGIKRRRGITHTKPDKSKSRLSKLYTTLKRSAVAYSRFETKVQS